MTSCKIPLQGGRGGLDLEKANNIEILKHYEALLTKSLE